MNLIYAFIVLRLADHALDFRVKGLLRYFTYLYNNKTCFLLNENDFIIKLSFISELELLLIN